MQVTKLKGKNRRITKFFVSKLPVNTEMINPDSWDGVDWVEVGESYQVAPFDGCPKLEFLDFQNDGMAALEFAASEHNCNNYGFKSIWFGGNIELNRGIVTGPDRSHRIGVYNEGFATVHFTFGLNQAPVFISSPGDEVAE